MLSSFKAPGVLFSHSANERVGQLDLFKGVLRLRQGSPGAAFLLGFEEPDSDTASPGFQLKVWDLQRGGPLRLPGIPASSCVVELRNLDLAPSFSELLSAGPVTCCLAPDSLLWPKTPGGLWTSSSCSVCRCLLCHVPPRRSLCVSIPEPRLSASSAQSPVLCLGPARRHSGRAERRETVVLPGVAHPPGRRGPAAGRPASENKFLFLSSSVAARGGRISQGLSHCVMAENVT